MCWASSPSSRCTTARARPLARSPASRCRTCGRGWRTNAGAACRPRSLARALSSVKGFMRWLADREGFDPTAVLSTRAPRFRKKLPRPLAVDAAQAMLDTVEMQAPEPWIAARDAAVRDASLGLRAADLRGAVARRRDAPARAEPAHHRQGRQGADRPRDRARPRGGRGLCRRLPLPTAEPAPLFRGARGGPLNPRLVQKAMERARLQLGLPVDRHAPRLRHSFATHLLSAGATCARSRSFWATRRCRPRRPTPRSTRARLMEVYARTHPRRDAPHPPRACAMESHDIRNPYAFPYRLHRARIWSMTGMTPA
jgi:integrase/recombinase XerC